MIPPAVVKSQQDRLQIRALDPHTLEEMTPDSVTITIYDSGNGLILAETPALFLLSQVYYDRTWAYSLGTYRAVWKVTVGGSVVAELEQYFDVVAHRWRMPIGVSDFAPKYPYLNARIPTGATMAQYLEAGWGEIGTIIYGRIGKHPGAIQYPEQFSYALEMMAVSGVYRAITMQPNSSEDMQAQQYKKAAVEAIDSALSHIQADMDDDLAVSNEEFGMILSDASLLRMKPYSTMAPKL